MKLNEPGRQKLRVPLWALGYTSRKLRVPLWARGHTSRHWGFLSEGSSLSSKFHKQKLRVPLWALGHTSRNWGFPLWTVGLTNRKLRVPIWALGLTSRNWGFTQAEIEGSALSSRSHKQKLRVPLWALHLTSRNWGFLSTKRFAERLWKAYKSCMQGSSCEYLIIFID